MSEANVHDREITRGREVVTRRIADETLIVPIAGGVGDLDAIYTLNGVAARIWQLLEEPTTAERIVRSIQEGSTSIQIAPPPTSRFLAALDRAASSSDLESGRFATLGCQAPADCSDPGMANAHFPDLPGGLLHWVARMKPSLRRIQPDVPRADHAAALPLSG